MNEIVYVDESEAVRAAEVESFKREFLRYAAMEDLSQPCPIGRRAFDPQRRETVVEVVADGLDDANALDRAIAILCRLAQGNPDEYHLLHVAARVLLNEAASSWADARVDV
jgi:hypothetical protein